MIITKELIKEWHNKTCRAAADIRHFGDNADLLISVDDLVIMRDELAEILKEMMALSATDGQQTD